MLLRALLFRMLTDLEVSRPKEKDWQPKGDRRPTFEIVGAWIHVRLAVLTL